MPTENDKPRLSLWERLERPTPPQRQTLSPQRIATTAVAIADAEGLEAITMRRLATELGVAPMAPYRYVSGKDDLLELMVDHVYADLHLPVDREWRETMRALALRTRELMLRHLWLAQLSPQARLSLTPNRMTVAERALSALDGLGLDADAMMSIFRAVDAYVHGAMNYESAVRNLIDEHGWSDGDDLRSELAPEMMWHMRTGRYPTFRRYLHTATRKDDAQWQFETGLTYVLDGIAATLAI
ncbi:TetR/AcrR family transcriptional regulator [Nonomuraea sp. 3-1Str]|uniref:TetR/AcrR family transcriptional regulator C-terminal domain-containing protein n=1 Tax=Nonomuraea sp. 3-1Str TaxID=2929801 RepID=UPI00285C8298|nr:TetR/AcrR family transcriptional regulator C-terminal domain-containing protein [Nonomuraea sp. 3-1Str]MDR8413612.1 TetR/AcrR family transcriptional regulator [Nonomuraea sp. 3-1Str]